MRRSLFPLALVFGLLLALPSFAHGRGGHFGGGGHFSGGGAHFGGGSSFGGSGRYYGGNRVYVAPMAPRYYAPRLGGWVWRPTQIWIAPYWAPLPAFCFNYPGDARCLDPRGMWVPGHWETRQQQVWVPGY